MSKFLRFTCSEEEVCLIRPEYVCYVSDISDYQKTPSSHYSSHAWFTVILIGGNELSLSFDSPQEAKDARDRLLSKLDELI